MGLIVDMKTMGGTMDVQTMSFESCFLGFSSYARDVLVSINQASSFSLFLSASK